MVSAPGGSGKSLLLADWVRAGGRLLMVGGYLSFTGIEAKANYRNTPLADVLPVYLPYWIDGVAFLVAGLIVFYFRPRLPAARAA